jgi:hypothetical protein
MSAASKDDDGGSPHRDLILMRALIAPHLSAQWRERSWNGVSVWL